MRFLQPLRVLTFGLVSFPVDAVGPYHSLADIFQGQLAGFNPRPDHKPDLGNLDLGKCCLRAVNESLEISDGYLQFRPGQTVLHGNVSTFLRYQFPCSAKYNGFQGDQPQVTISYSWCRHNCRGWAKTVSYVDSDWVEPLVAFIFPAVVFCFTIPRRRRIMIPSALFPATQAFKFPKNLALLYQIPLSTLVIIADALLWVAISIVVAGPMLLSGSLEILLDSRLLTFLTSKDNDNYLSSQSRAHLLMIVLNGNLDQDPAWDDTKRAVTLLPKPDTSQRHASNEILQSSEDSKVNARTHASSPTPSALTASDGASTSSGNEGGLSAPSQMNAVKVRLASLLESQPGFGNSVGIGVVFYVSSFFYSIEEIKQNYGDGGTGHSLAFGIFWMTIGHVAVVAGVLLAGNNPSAWEGIAAGLEGRTPPPARWEDVALRRRSSVRRWAESSVNKRRLLLPSWVKKYFYRTAYPSEYRTAWMWNRGNTKAMWIARFIEENPHLERLQRDVLRMGWVGWLFGTTVPALFLFAVPTFLGGMVSYVTPTVGISCRSLGPLLYSFSQTLLVGLCLYDWKYWKRNGNGEVLDGRNENAKLPIAKVLWYGLFFFCLLTAVTSAIGGALFQLMGLYRNCLCYIPIYYWSTRYDPDVTMYLGNNSNEQIHNARVFWLPIGITATAFLIMTAYIGWRYQHGLRRQFLDAVRELDCEGRRLVERQRKNMSAQGIEFQNVLMASKGNNGLEEDQNGCL